MTTVDRSESRRHRAARRVAGRRAAAVLVGAAALALLAGCPAVPQDAIDGVDVTPATAALFVGEQVQLSADVSVVSGYPSTAVAWTSDDAAVATVDATGLVTARGEGQAKITATSAFDDTFADDAEITATFPEPAAVACEEIDEGAAGPTLLCTVADGAVTVRVPWQGEDVLVDSLPLDDLFWLPGAADFAPLTPAPTVRLAVATAAGGLPVTAFDPPMWLTIDYDAPQFAAAEPLVDLGELGLGAWDPVAQAWIVLGYGVWHEGFWLADPIAGGGIELTTDTLAGQPRFQLTGGPSGGTATVVVAQSLPELAVMWGAMPPDPDHMLKEFDGPCEEVSLGTGTAVECVSSMVGLTVRVPLQEGGTVTPRVIALPWNKTTTFPPDEISPQQADLPANLVRRLMNFLVVDADDPTRVLTSFDPPLEFEIAYTAADKDPEVNPLLVVKYWDEYFEQWVWLGFGFTDSCTDQLGATEGDCVWGFAEAAGLTDDPRFQGEGFFLTNPDGQGGIAKFTYDLWGDRLVAFGR